MRRAHDALSAKQLSTDPTSGETHVRHHITADGYYRGKQVIVRINDRGPFHASRIVDVSYTAALKLGLLGKGSHEVELERLLPGDPVRVAVAAPPPVMVAAQPVAALRHVPRTLLRGPA